MLLRWCKHSLACHICDRMSWCFSFQRWNVPWDSNPASGRWVPVLALLQIAPGIGGANSWLARMKLVAGPVAATGLSGYDPEHSTASVPRDVSKGAPVWARSRIPQPPRLQLSALSCLDYRSEKVAVGRIRTCNDVRIFGPFFLSADRTIGPPCARYPRPLQCCQLASCPGGLSLPPL